MELARWDEQQLVQRCKEGSEAAFAELVRRYRPRLFTLAYRLTSDRETAEDVVQETFVAAFRALDRFEPRPSLSAWLNTILIRLAARSATRAESRPRGSLDAMLATEAGGNGMTMVAGAVPHDDPHAAAETAELRQELARAIASLPFKYRAAVVTRYILGLDYGEAASALEVGLNTYKSHLLRGTRILRNLLVDSVGERPEAAPGLDRVTDPGARAAPRPAIADGVEGLAQVSTITTRVFAASSVSRPGPLRRPTDRPGHAERRVGGESPTTVRSTAAGGFGEARSPRFADRLPGEGPLRG